MAANFVDPDDFVDPDEEEKRSIPQELARQAGLGVRMGVEGAADWASVIANPLAVMSNRIFGTQLPQDYTARIGQALTNLGVPTPATPAERIANFGGRAGAGGIEGVLAGKAIPAATAGLTAARQFLADTPTAQVLAPMVGGSVQQGAIEAGVDPTIAAGIGLAATAGTAAPTALLETGKVSLPQRNVQMTKGMRESGVIPLPDAPTVKAQQADYPTLTDVVGLDELDAQLRIQGGLGPPSYRPPVNDRPGLPIPEVPVPPAPLKDAGKKMPVTPVKWTKEKIAPEAPVVATKPSSPDESTVSFLGMGKAPQVWEGIKQAYADKIGDPAWDWIKEVGTGQRHKVQDGTLAGNLVRGLVSNYGLPEDYVMLKRTQGNVRNAINESVVPMLNELVDLPMSDRKLFYRMLQGEAPTTAELSGLKANTREVIDRTGQMMVDTGLLDPETYAKNVGTYLHRSYTSKQPTKQWFGQATRFVGNELKPRGVLETVDASDVQRYVDTGWEVFGKPHNGKQTVRMQLTPEQRTALGEIDDAAYAMAKTMLSMSNDIATYKFYDDVAKKYGTDVAQPGYVQMSMDKIAKTGINRYGNLAGKYVPEEIAADFKRVADINQYREAPIAKSLLKGQSAWKVSKTALSPVAHFNNITSNVSLYYLSDAKWEHLGQGFREAFKDVKDSPLKKLAIEHGVVDAQMATQELSAFARSQLDDFMKLQGEPDNLLKFSTNAAHKTWKATGQKAIDTYNAEDMGFRLAVFEDRLKKGLPVEEAAAEARKWFIDYNINAKYIQFMRDVTHPFLAYPYRMVPLLAETAVKRPWKFGVLAGLWGGANMMGESKAREEGRDPDAERATMSPHQNQNMFGMPFLPKTNINTGFATPDGRSIYLNTFRNIPGGDIFEIGEGSGLGNDAMAGLPLPLQPSGGLFGAAINAWNGRDSFTGEKLKGLGFGASTDIPIKLGAFGQSLLPNVPGVPGTFATNKVKQALAGQPTPLGDVNPPWMAIVQGLGPKPNIVDTTKNIQRANFDIQQHYRKAKEVVSEARRDLNRGIITEEQFNAIRDEWKKNAEDYRDEVLKRLESGRKPPTPIQ